MKFIETIKNIWKIEDLRNRLLITCLFVLIYRFGSFVMLPGLSPAAIDALINGRAGEATGLASLLDMFSGGAFSNASVFALGIMPYISASIIVQLLTIAVPYFQKMQRDGESGRQRMTQITRYITIPILLLQGWAYTASLGSQIGVQGACTGMDQVISIIILCAGSMFVMWLGERITDKGVGNGISFIILIGIIARLPEALIKEFSTCLGAAGGGLFKFVIEIVLLFVVVALTIMLVQGTRKIPVQYAKRIVGNRQMGGVRQYIPLKVNAANVMPIIFAQAIMFIPPMFAGFSENPSGLMQAFTNIDGVWYNVVSALLIVFFTYFYTAIIINPTQMAEDMKRNNGFIPGVKPGKKTAQYIDTIMSRITLPGSLFLALVAVLPVFARMIGMDNSFAHFFGGTSLLILVGVILDTLQQIESHLLMRHYDGLLDSGRIMGRTGSMASY